MRNRRIQTEAARRRTVGYVRVSTEDQAAGGVSLAAQEARIRAYAIAQARELDEIIVDAGESAKTLERPGMVRILGEMRRGAIEAVVVIKLDRLTRSVRDLDVLLELTRKHDVALVSISESLDTSSAAGRLVVNMLASVAQWEREAIGERTASALAHKRANGQVYGSTPFGFRRVGNTLVRDAGEQSALAEMQRLDAAGASYREIARMLEERGVKPRKGGARWYASSVQSVLRSKSSSAMQQI